MSSTAAACLVVAALTSLAGKPDVVAVSPCIVGPGVGQELGAAVTEMVVTSIMGLPGVAVLDRSLTKAVVREQDLTLVSRAAAVLPQRFGDLGAEQVLAVGLLETSSGFVLSLRLIDVATGEVLKSAVHQVRSRTKLLAECGDYARALWDQAGDGSASAGAPLAVDAALEDMWRRLDHGQVRQLLGPHLDRAESVYRQYVRAVQTGSADQAEHLAHMASIYLTDCLSWLQRALDPPVGMVYVPPGWVTLSVPGTRTRRFWVGAFFMDRCAYTREEYLRFLEASSRAKPLGWTDPSEQTADLPVVGLDWHDAEAAAEWRGGRRDPWAARRDGVFRRRGGRLGRGGRRVARHAVTHLSAMAARRARRAPSQVSLGRCLACGALQFCP